MIRTAAFTVLLLGAYILATRATFAGNTSLSIELNRLEERTGGCRVHLVLTNASARSYSSYRLDLVIFASDGVIARRLALETAPLRANKTMVKEFELADLTCDGIGRVLLNDVSACVTGDGNLDDCVTTTRVSRATRSSPSVPWVRTARC